MTVVVGVRADKCLLIYGKHLLPACTHVLRKYFPLCLRNSAMFQLHMHGVERATKNVH